MAIENIIFTSAELLVEGCTEHWCMHCHKKETLFGWDGAASSETQTNDLISAHGHDFGPADNLDQNFIDLLDIDNCGNGKGWYLGFHTDE